MSLLTKTPLALAFILASSPVPAAPSPAGVPIAATFDADRVAVDMPAPDGRRPLHLFTDSGGGSLILSKEAAARLGLKLNPVTDPESLAELGHGTAAARATPFMKRRWPGLPAQAELLVVPDFQSLLAWPSRDDGMLGQSWFGGHSWTWDYPGRRLTLRPPHWRPAAAATPLAVSFKTGADGRRVSNFPRMTIRVDGEELPMLFDTGATTFLTDPALQAIADGQPALRATSMIAQVVFERWRSKHPDWKVIEDGQAGTHSRMIEVPSVEIAGHATGPVWFTERPDKNFHEYMSSMMSGMVEGAIGGNAFHSLIITIDYPDALAWVQ
jgi:hypothetical protein